MGPEGRRKGSLLRPRMLSLVVYTWQQQQQQHVRLAAAYWACSGCELLQLLPPLLLLSLPSRMSPI
jgi:hypothetical protein